MKRFTTLLAAMILSIPIFAGRGPRQLTITNLDNPNIVVYVDGHKYQGIRNALVLSDMSFGYHNVKVIRVKGAGLIMTSCCFHRGSTCVPITA